MGTILNKQKLMSANAISSGTTEYSTSTPFQSSLGFNAILITLTAASNVTISLECSEDNSTFYTPYDSEGNVLGTVCTNLTATRYIQFTPVLAPYIRFKVVASADSTVTIEYFFQERT